MQQNRLTHYPDYSGLTYGGCTMHTNINWLIIFIYSVMDTVVDITWSNFFHWKNRSRNLQDFYDVVSFRFSKKWRQWISGFLRHDCGRIPMTSINICHYAINIRFSKKWSVLKINGTFKQATQLKRSILWSRKSNNLSDWPNIWSTCSLRLFLKDYFMSFTGIYFGIVYMVCFNLLEKSVLDQDSYVGNTMMSVIKMGSRVFLLSVFPWYLLSLPMTTLTF